MSRASRIVSAVFFLITSAASAQTGVFVPSPVFDGGGMRMQVHLHGQIGSSSDSRGAGLFWPGDGVSSPLSRTLCYSSTPVFIGRIQDERLVSASYYRNSFLPGPIVGGKPPGDPTAWPRPVRTPPPATGPGPRGPSGFPLSSYPAPP